jgi:hypothetical protein
MATCWQTEIMAPTTAWHLLTVFDYRNVVGTACGGARRIDDLLIDPGPVPGALRYTVKPGSIVSGVSATLFCDVQLVGDLHHPYIDKTTGYSVNLNAWNEIHSGSDTEIYVSSAITESSVFDVGYGYELASDNSWVPILSFGVNFPGYFGNSAFVRLTNTSEYDQCSCRIAWSNDGSTPSLWRVRMQGSDWGADGADELLFNADGAVDGLVPIGESVILEIQPSVPSGTTAIDNPVIGTFQIFSVSI